MSIVINDVDRQIVPRFLDYFSASTLGLLRTIHVESETEKFLIAENVKSEWKLEPNIYNAVDLVGEAILTKDFSSQDALNAAQYLLNNSKTSKFMLMLAKHYLQEEINISPNLKTTETYQEKISKIKKFLDIYPRNPIAWSDLSLCYAALGSKEKSLRAIEVALNLGKNNRFILRSAARCFVFHDEPD
jgi:tetratricopeptide (TPR) repeat protein